MVTLPAASKAIYKTSMRRDIGRMDVFDTQREVAGLIDALKPDERRQIMAALAERYGFRLMDKQTANNKSPTPTFRKKRIF